MRYKEGGGERKEMMQDRGRKRDRRTGQKNQRRKEGIPFDPN